MINFEERDSLLETISDCVKMNRIMNDQAKKIENRIGAYWQTRSDEEIEKKVSEYDHMIGQNYKTIDACLKKLMGE